MEAGIVLGWFVPVENLGHFWRLVVLPFAILELVAEVQDEQRMLEVDENEASIDTLLACILLIWYVVNGDVSIFVIYGNFLLKFGARVSAGEILHA